MSVPLQHDHAPFHEPEVRAFFTRHDRKCLVRWLPRRDWPRRLTIGRPRMGTLLFECDGHWTTYDPPFGFDSVRAIPIGELRDYFEQSG
jgi:hypothetical protein